MTPPPALLFALLAAGLVRPAPAPPPPAGIAVAQVTIRQRIIIRIPAHRSSRYREAPDIHASPPVYAERHGPRCLAAGAIAGAAISSPDSVDFILKGGDRYRALLDGGCPSLDYYAGFYVAPEPDRQVCADRDSIRTRSGGACQIDKFKRLVPIRP